MSGPDIAGVLAPAALLVGAFAYLVTAIGMLRAKDAISRVNNLSPATGIGLPMIIVGAVLHDLGQGDLTVLDGIKAVLAIAASLVVSSVASNMLARAAYRSQEVIDPRTVSNALAPEDPTDPSAATEGHSD